MSDKIPQWSDAAVAEAFRAEIRARLEAHNAWYPDRELSSEESA